MAGKIVEYALVESEYGIDFDKHVNSYLDKGFELYGELKLAAVYGSRSSDTGDEVIMCFAQALVRREQSEFMSA